MDVFGAEYYLLVQQTKDEEALEEAEASGFQIQKVRLHSYIDMITGMLSR